MKLNQTKLGDLPTIISRLTADEDLSKSALHLTANENVLSKTAERFLNCSLSNRYHIGAAEEHISEEACANAFSRVGEFTFKSLKGMYRLEKEAHQALCMMLNANACDTRSLSGIHALLSTLLSCSSAGDTVYSLPPFLGGHHATKQIVESAGRTSHFLPINHPMCCIDIEACAKMRLPNLVLLDDSSPLGPLPVAELRATFPTSLIVYDASHSLGLMAGGRFQSPLREGANILQANTHKTFFGPQKGCVLFHDPYQAAAFSNAMGAAFVSSQHTGSALALHISTLEMKEFGKAYVEQMINNRDALEEALLSRGFNLYRHPLFGYSQSHILFIEEQNAFQFCERLHRENISTNTKTLYGKKFIRIGLQEITRRGMKHKEMDQIATYLAHVKREKHLGNAIEEFTSQFQQVYYSYDNAIGYP